MSTHAGETIYLDNALAGRPSSKVFEAMEPYYRDFWAVASAPYHQGQRVMGRLESLYDSIYELCGADEQCTFILTSSGTEAVNHLLLAAYLDITREKGKNHYLTTSIGEAPTILGFGRLEQLGCVCKMVDVGSKGYLSVQELAEAITPRTAFLSLSWADGMTGVVQPLEEIIALCRDRGIFLHVEGSHFLGRGYVDFEAMRPDALTFNGENLHGPRGTGGILLREGLRVSPLLLGSQDQGGMRGGHLDVAGLAGLSHAAQEAAANVDHMCTEIARLRDLFEEKVTSQTDGIKALFQEEERSPATSCMVFEGVANEAMLFCLDRERVCANTGGGIFQQMALILKGTGLDPMLAQTGVSFSLSRDTTQDEIERSADVVVKTYKKLKDRSQKVLVEEKGGDDE